MNSFKVMSLLLLLSSNVCAGTTVLDKIEQMKEPVAKLVTIDMQADLENDDFGAYKEFLINLDQVSFINYKVLKRAKGHIFSQSVLSPINHQEIHVSVKELDEYHGMSIDGIIAAPFNAVNGDDDYLNTFLEDGGQVIAQYESDSIEVRSLEKKTLNGAELLGQMKILVKGCKLNQNINLFFNQSDEERANCRNFAAAMASLHAQGLDKNELRELVRMIDSGALDNRVEMSLANIEWWTRNFDR